MADVGVEFLRRFLRPNRRPMTPIYAGQNRAFVRLRTGEFLCVDTNSIESIDFLCDREIEPHVFPVMRRFLRPESTVLDIGANFGFYTVTTASVVKDHGYLYAFEAHPHTFEILRRSARANGILGHARVKLYNVLLSDSSGTRDLNFAADELGGATVLDATHWGLRRQSVAVKASTADQVLPADCVIDFAKIDVEGHEPFVIKGMERLLARSPNARLLIECFDHMIDKSFGLQRFVEYIDELGFRMCLVRPDSSLEVVPRRFVLRGENYVLLTRTPDADAEKRYFTITPLELSYPPRFLKDGENALLESGSLIFTRERFGTKDALIFYGPYINLEKGRYEIRFRGELSGRVNVRFTKNKGQLIEKTTLESLSEPIRLELTSTTNDFEIVMESTHRLESLKLNAVDIETT